MENASKALIIAGAILLSILIISFGIIVINNVRGNITGANVNDTEIQAFNSKFTAYVGNGKSAAQIEQLIQAAMTNNISENASQTNRFVQVTYGGQNYGSTTEYKVITAIPTVPNSQLYNVGATYGPTGLITVLTVTGASGTQGTTGN